MIILLNHSITFKYVTNKQMYTTKQLCWYVCMYVCMYVGVYLYVCINNNME